LGKTMVALPDPARSPWWELGRRLLMALAILVGTVLLVYFDREGYRDGNDPPDYAVSLTDSIYYTTVTLSTTGYGPPRPAWSTHSSSPRPASPSWCC
jgi:voltage-gated potassium channel